MATRFADSEAGTTARLGGAHRTDSTSQTRVEIYDTTLRDGTQGEGVSLSVQDKLLISRKLDELGVDFIEGGYPLSNPKDAAFFEEAKSLKLSHAKLVAFGMTRRKGISAAEDTGMGALRDAGTEYVTVVGKTWDLHATEVLGVSLEENLEMIADSVRYLTGLGRKVIYDAEHFFDGTAANQAYGLKTIEAAARAGAVMVCLCDTNGGSLPERVADFVSLAKGHLEKAGLRTPLGIHPHNDLGVAVANALALMAIVASPAVLSRVVMDTHASGPVTDRALTLSTLNTFYAITLGYAQAGLIERAPSAITERIYPVLVVLGMSFVVGAAVALAMRSALRVMSPTSENTSILMLALIAAGAAVSAHMGGSAPLAALIGGIMLKQVNPRPWSWPSQLGTAASLLTMLMFVLVSIVAAQADWNLPVASLVFALIAARGVAKVVGVSLGNPGSGTNWKQALWVGGAMAPLSSIALLIASNFVTASPLLGVLITQTALPVILLMEVSGAVIVTIAIHLAGESSVPWTPEAFSTTEDNAS